ncbi:MAG: hypothetical protein KGY80_09230 [Candidatus Thorarchaeota archaeon]|nr:hypothetical protein [Candidatus Thorarchaeota archaeon]
MSNQQKLIEVLQSQIDVEKKTFEELSEYEDESSQAVIRLVLLFMRLDTQKHQKFLEGVINLLNESPCDAWSAKVDRYTERINLERRLQSLLKQEEQMTDYLGEAIEEMDNPVARKLLSHLREDEMRHQEDIKELVTLVKQYPLQPKKGEKGSDITCDE